MISDRAKRVMVYTASLLIAPVPIMAYEKGTRAYLLSITVCGAILTASSFHVAQGESRLKHRSLVGNKLLAASVITLLFGMLMIVVAAVYLSRV